MQYMYAALAESCIQNLFVLEFGPGITLRTGIELIPETKNSSFLSCQRS